MGREKRHNAVRPCVGYDTIKSSFQAGTLKKDLNQRIDRNSVVRYSFFVCPAQ